MQVQLRCQAAIATRKRLSPRRRLFGSLPSVVRRKGRKTHYTARVCASLCRKREREGGTKLRGHTRWLGTSSRNLSSLLHTYGACFSCANKGHEKCGPRNCGLEEEGERRSQDHDYTLGSLLRGSYLEPGIKLFFPPPPLLLDEDRGGEPLAIRSTYTGCVFVFVVVVGGNRGEIRATCKG